MNRTYRPCLAGFFIAILCLFAAPLHAQDNYEIQVYGSETVAPKTTMVELHSNFTIDGFKAVPGSPYTAEGLYPTNHAEHETVEITQGITSWSELGFYIFTSYQDSYGYQWVGDHIRPRVRAPDKWHLPVGLSISNEMGYQRARFFPDTWTWEIRPIIDKQIGPWYFSFNPAFDRSFHGDSVDQGVTFSPDFKLSYDFTKKITGGFEYYGAVGPATDFLPTGQQQHQIFPTIDLNLSPKWEVNFGLGVGVTHSTDHLIAKMILGYRFNF